MTSPNNVALLECRGIRKTFDGVLALRNVTLRFPNAGAVLITGPNGAGKSTLLDVLSGVVRPDCGTCSVNGKDLTGASLNLFAENGISRTFQDARIIGSLSAVQNVVLACTKADQERLWVSLLGLGRSRKGRLESNEALKVLQMLGLADRAECPAREMSYGQQRLLALACCVSRPSSVLLLDEPVSGVGLEFVDRVLGLVARCRQRQLVVIVEHNLAVVRRFVDVVVVMDAGAIMCQGPPDVVLERDDVREICFGAN